MVNCSIELINKDASCLPSDRLHLDYVVDVCDLINDIMLCKIVCVVDQRNDIAHIVVMQ
jgi:hypothetical protein